MTAAYLLDTWYIAAWADELGSTPLVRTLLDQPVVVFRGSDAVPIALQDRCPHRFAPLSMGTIQDGLVTCPYHGLAFGSDGRCVRNPHGPLLRSLKVAAFPTVETFGAIWIWMGERDAADRTLIPDYSFLESAPASARSKGYVRGQGNYQLFVDNILDLTHADYLHPDTLGSGAFTRTKAKVSAIGPDAVSIRWDCDNEVPSPLQASRMPVGQDRVDSWTEVLWQAPANLVLSSGCVPVGAPKETGGSVCNLHLMTPETQRSTHYFYAATRSYSENDETVNERIARTRDRIFTHEDEPMIRAQQERMGDADFWELRPALLPIDEGAVRVRRTLGKLIARQQDSAAA